MVYPKPTISQGNLKTNSVNTRIIAPINLDGLAVKGIINSSTKNNLSLLASHDILVPSRLQDVLAGKMAYDRAVRDKLNSTSGLLETSRHFGFLGPSTATKQGDNGSSSVTSGKPKYRDTPDVDGREMSRIRKQRAERRGHNEQ